MNNTMNHETIKEAVAQIGMPEGLAGELLTGCLQRKHRGGILFRHARLAVAVTCVISIFMMGMPVYAAYDIYQSKNLDVFFTPNLSEERMKQLGEELAAIEGISSVKFVGADEAWENFAQEYLTEDLTAAFAENPLADSASYRVAIRLDADSQTIINQILQLDGVRHTGTLKEIARQTQAYVYFEPGTTLEQMEQVGAALNQMEEVRSVTFISVEEAWDSFKKEYLTEDLVAFFPDTENPLEDCANYYIIIDSGTNIQAVLSKIEGMEGVRKVNHS